MNQFAWGFGGAVGSQWEAPSKGRATVFGHAACYLGFSAQWYSSSVGNVWIVGVMHTTSFRCWTSTRSREQHVSYSFFSMLLPEAQVVLGLRMNKPRGDERVSHVDILHIWGKPSRMNPPTCFIRVDLIPESCA